jgi:hypothetical protein
MNYHCWVLKFSIISFIYLTSSISTSLSTYPSLSTFSPYHEMDDICRGDIPSQTVIESVLAVLKGEHHPTVNGVLNFSLISFIYPIPSISTSLFPSIYISLSYHRNGRQL